MAHPVKIHLVKHPAWVEGGPCSFIEHNLKIEMDLFRSSVEADGVLQTDEDWEQHRKEHDENQKKYELIQQETINRIHLTYNSLYLIPSQALEDKWLERVVRFLDTMAEEDSEQARALLQEIGFYEAENDSRDCYSCGGGGLERHGRFGTCLTCGGSGKVQDEQD